MGSSLTKNELFHIHRLLDQVGEFMLDEEDIESGSRDYFSFYSSFEVFSDDIRVNKNEHQDAIMILSHSLADFAQNDQEEFLNRFAGSNGIKDDLVIKTAGEKHSDLDFDRKESAEEISELVDYASTTVYDKFSDFGIRFSDHEVKYTDYDDEERNQALNLLQSYANKGEERKTALEKVSQETGVDERSLDNWLVDEDILFTDRVSAVVDPESKKELIETAQHYFNLEKGVDSIEQSLGYNIDTLRLYREDEIGSMPVELLEKLDSLFESEPIFRMEDPDRYIQEDTRYGLKVDDVFQSFLFSHISGEELEGMTGQTVSTLTRYRNNRSKTVDREAYRKAFQAVSFKYEKHPEPEIEKFIHSETGNELSEEEIHSSF